MLSSEVDIRISNQMIESFLSYESHYQLFMETVCHPTKENQNQLNQAFKDFYNEIRFKKYISTTLWRYARDYLAKEKTERTRYLLKMDQPIQGQESDGAKQSSYGDQLSAKEDHREMMVGRFLDRIENPELYGVLKQLTKKQLRILELSIFHHLNHSEIAVLLGISQQAVSKSIRQSLTKIRERLKGENNGTMD